MACGDVLSLEDLQTAKKHQIFEAEVITGKVGGVAGGASIDYATNPVTGQTQQTLPSILADLGFDVQSWTSSTGGVLASANQVFLNDTSGSLGLGDYYAWGGAFPKTVPAGTDPALVGGGYIMRSSRFAGLQAREALRRSYAEAGYTLVSGSFEAGGTLVNANDVLLQESTGKAFSGPAGTVAAGTNPASGGFVDISNVSLYEFHAATYGLKEGNTGLENCKALQALGAAAMAAGTAKIIIPSGTFKIGAQTFAGATGKGYSYKLEDALFLKNMSRVHIHFCGTKIVGEAGMKIGSFDPVTGAVYTPPAGSFLNYNYRADFGVPFRIENCKSVTITGSAEFDGNDATRIVGGYWGDSNGGYQVYDSPLHVLRYDHLDLLANIYAHDWAGDTLYVGGRDAETNHTTIDGYIGIRAGRNALSLTGGANIHLRNSMFGFVGKGGSGINSMPRAGMDVETEIDSMRNLVVTDCQFLDSGSAVTSENFNRVRGASFERCKFWSRNPANTALWWRVAGTKFIDCEFIGPIVWLTGGASAYQLPRNVQMIRCVFTNVTHDGAQVKPTSVSFALITSVAPTTINGVQVRTEFIDCDFRCRISDDIDATKNMVWINSGILKNCRMQIEGATAGTQPVITANGAKIDGLVITNSMDYTGGLTNSRPFISVSNADVQNAYLTKNTMSDLVTIVWQINDSVASTYGWYTTTAPNGNANDINPSRALGLRKNSFYYPSVAQTNGGAQCFSSHYDVPTSGNFVKGDVLFHYDATPGQPMGWQCTTTGVAGSTAIFKPLANLGT